MSGVLYATTPFPNHLLDEAMPHLKDTEWRVLCVIVRQTLGWQSKDGKQRKTSDWLTQAQLVKKTGRDRAALSRAVDVLVQGKYIEVRNNRGVLLQSATERRQCKGRLFYGLCDKSEYQMPDSNSLLNNRVTKSEYHRALKANTTKETLTKEIVTKGIHQNSLHRTAAEVFENKIQPGIAPIQGSLPCAAPEYSAELQSFIALFERLHQQTRNREADIRLSLDDARCLEKLLESRPSFDWTPVLQAFFESDAGYVTRRNYSLQSFANFYNIFLVGRSLSLKSSPRHS